LKANDIETKYPSCRNCFFPIPLLNLLFLVEIAAPRGSVVNK